MVNTHAHTMLPATPQRAACQESLRLRLATPNRRSHCRVHGSVSGARPDSLSQGVTVNTLLELESVDICVVSSF
jgi:hypothetical protein